MEKRIALLKDGVVFNIIVGPSAEEMATLFNCEAIEVTPETLQAHIGYGFANGVFDSPPVEPDPIPEETPVGEEIIEETPVEEEN
jgi:hypothetical protein